MEPFLVHAIFWSLLIGLFLLSFYLRRAMFRKAFRDVIAIFRRTRSLCSQDPKRADEMGLQGPGFMDRFLKPKDYKPYVLHAMIMGGIVRQHRDGKVCLLEEKVPESLPGRGQGFTRYPKMF